MPEYAKKFYLHYNFPPFCVGEAGRIMGPGRREIGHGGLAERSLLSVLPDVEEFPYTEFGTEVSGRANFSTKFMDLGIKLLVTPHVYEDPQGIYVRLELEPDPGLDLELFAEALQSGLEAKFVKDWRGQLEGQGTAGPEGFVQEA